MCSDISLTMLKMKLRQLNVLRVDFEFLLLQKKKKRGKGSAMKSVVGVIW